MKRRDCPKCNGEKCEVCDWMGYLETCDFFGKVVVKPKSLADIYKDEAGEYSYNPNDNHGPIDRKTICRECQREYYLCKGCLGQHNTCECGATLWRYYN